jgi:polyisoprenoid-binding protein YceI
MSAGNTAPAIRSLFAALVFMPVVLSAQAPASAGAESPRAPADLPLWKIDASHSELSFSIRHLVSRVRGQFGVWGGTIAADPADWSTASVQVTADAATIDTNNDRRDADLKSPAHFDAEANPKITFTSTRIRRLAGDSLAAEGNLTIRGVTRPVVFHGRFGGIMGSTGKRRAGFSAVAVINRKDFGMLWNRAVEGGNLLGDEVRIDLDVAAVEQSPAK